MIVLTPAALLDLQDAIMRYGSVPMAGRRLAERFRLAFARALSLIDYAPYGPRIIGSRELRHVLLSKPFALHGVFYRPPPRGVRPPLVLIIEAVLYMGRDPAFISRRVARF